MLLWTGVTLSLVPLAISFWWIYEHVLPAWSMVLALSVPIIAFVFSVLPPPAPVLPARAAQGGLILYVVLMVLGPKARKAG